MSTTTERPTTRGASRDALMMRLCAWAGPVFVLTLFVSVVVIMSFVPPPREHWSAAELTAFYDEHSLGIRLGGTLFMLVAPAYYLWSLAIDRVLSLTEPQGSAIRRIQMFGGFSTSYVAALTGLFWTVAAFYGTRPGADPQIVIALNDLGFIIFNLWFVFTLVQLLVMAFVWLSPDSHPLVPRWLGYWALFDAVSFFAVVVMPFVKTGPVAWHGAIAFYVVLGLFLVWTLTTSWQVRRVVIAMEAPDHA